MPRILVVEDSPTQAMEIRSLLEESGFVVTIADDGVEALRSIRGDPPDLVVTDLEMPWMNGLALVELVKKEYPFVPLVLVTSYGSEEIAAQALREGAASYVPKRYLGRDLAATVREVADLAIGRARRQKALERLETVNTRYVLDNDAKMVAPLVRHIENDLTALRFCDATTLIRVGVALREALINAIEHGNLELSSELREREGREYWTLGERRRRESPYRDRRVHVTVIASAEEATFVVRDEGPGFSAASLPNAAAPGSIDRLSGRGLLLIRTFMDGVTFNDAGNEITLKKRGLAAGPV